MINQQKRIEYIGETRVNRNGTLMKIVEYIDARHVIVEFQDEHHYRKVTDYAGFNKGKTDNPYDKTMYGIGYRGVGKYGAYENDKKIYGVWQAMFGRCYGTKPNETKPCYAGCEVAPIWHNFQNFGAWYELNYYEIPGQIMQLDKDILYKKIKFIHLKLV